MSRVAWAGVAGRGWACRQMTDRRNDEGPDLSIGAFVCSLLREELWWVLPETPDPAGF